MSITRFILALAVMALLLALPGVVLAQAQPPRPPVFGGTAILSGVPAPDGATVSALIDGAEVAATTVKNGAYAFTIPQPPGESYSGKTVTFLIEGVTATESGTWEADGGGELNLSASGVPTPQVITETPGQTPQATTETQTKSLDQNAGTATEAPKRKAFVGIVNGTPGDSVTLDQKGNKGSITIKLDNPKIKTPGGPRVRGTFTNGARVVIQARNDGTKLDTVWVAIRVLVKPVKPTVASFHGAVVEVVDGVLTIMQPDGSTKEVELEAGASAPEIGELVTGFAGPAGDDGDGGASKPAKAKGLLKASKIRERLEGFLQELTTENRDLPKEADEAKAKTESAQGKAEAARTKATAARTKATAAQAKATAAQGANAAEAEEQAADAEEEAAEAEADLAEAEAEVAEVQAEAEAAERRAEQVADVASILDSLTTQHTDILRSLAEGSTLPAEAMQGIATALENAQRGRNQANLKATEARAKAEDKEEQALAKAEEKREEALAKAEEKRKKVLARVEEKKDRALARAEDKKEKALAKPVEEREQVLAKAEEEKEKALAKAEEEKENALAKAEDERQKAQAEQEREAAKAQAEREREAAQGGGNSQGKGNQGKGR